MPAVIRNENRVGPITKRTKLVLPAPQISDQELEQVVKLGNATESAKKEVSETGTTATVTLLGDYNLTPDINRIRTPQLPTNQDSILNQAHNLNVLNNVQTPLLGGSNTPLMDVSNEGGRGGAGLIQATPNTLFQTPSRTPTTANQIATPTINRGSNEFSTGATPMRDQLNINAEEMLYDDQVKQREVKQLLRHNLSRLPKPKNDFEIVLPETNDPSANEEEKMDASTGRVEDQADIDRRKREEKRRQDEANFKRQTQVVQRQLPRPNETNSNILRDPANDSPLTDIQKAEEMIKEEMLVLLNYDAVYNPVSGSSNRQRENLAFLETHPYQQFTDEDLKTAKSLLENEMQTVKKSLGHADLTLDAYSQVWDECYSQLLYLPSKNRFVRVMAGNKKDRIESAEHKLELNRTLMASEAKRAGKLEKKLKTLLGGYQARSEVLIEALNNIYDQIYQSQVESKTFDLLRQNELLAIPKRTQSFADDVTRQEERERELQRRYQELCEEFNNLCGEN